MNFKRIKYRKDFSILLNKHSYRKRRKTRIMNKVLEESHKLIAKIQIWKNLFAIKRKPYLDGWTIVLREKYQIYTSYYYLYTRVIIISKLFKDDTYSINIFNNYKAEYKELYTIDNIKDHNSLLEVLKEVIFKMDLLNSYKRN